MIAWRDAARLFLLAGLLRTAAGCSHRETIPTYEPMPPDQTIARLKEHAQRIRTVSASGTIHVKSPRGISTSLDIAIALQPPDHARFRAWKFGQTVGDLAVIPDGTYVVAPNGLAKPEQIRAAGLRAGEIVRKWLRLASGRFNTSDVEDHGATLVATQKLESGETLVSMINRRTITPRRYALIDQAGEEQFTLRLSQYVESNGLVWPSRVEARTKAGFEFRLNLREIEVNGELPQEAFRPPGRAEKLP
jgi:outer membrane lipoprotein-sorting protein